MCVKKNMRISIKKNIAIVFALVKNHCGLQDMGSKLNIPLTIRGSAYHPMCQTT